MVPSTVTLRVAAIDLPRRRSGNVYRNAWGGLGPGRGQTCLAPGETSSRTRGTRPPLSPAPEGAGRELDQAYERPERSRPSEAIRSPLPGLGNSCMPRPQGLAFRRRPAGYAGQVGLRPGLYTCPPAGGRGTPQPSQSPTSRRPCGRLVFRQHRNFRVLWFAAPTATTLFSRSCGRGCRCVSNHGTRRIKIDRTPGRRSRSRASTDDGRVVACDLTPESAACEPCGVSGRRPGAGDRSNGLGKRT